VAPILRRSGLVTLAAALLLSTLGFECAPAPPPAVEPDDVRTIEDFVRCINPRLAGNPDVSVADTVQCLPPKCSITLTMSDTSAQPACFVGDCQMPRVLLECPGPPKFMPSYLLCPSDEGHERVEIGEAIDGAGNMRMADIHIHPGAFVAIDETDVVSEDDSKGCNSNGSTCHTEYIPPSTTDKRSAPIDPFDGAPAFGNPDCIIATDRCDKSAIKTPKNCFGSDTEPRTARPQSLSEVCDCIEAGNTNPDHPLFLFLGGEGLAVEELCHALETYQDTRGACTAVGCPPSTGPECEDPGSPCDPSTGATVTAAAGYHCQPTEEDIFQCIADCPCRDYDLLGGGKFLVNTAVSMVRLKLDGLVATPDPDQFADNDHLNGELEAFNYLSRTLVQSVSFSSLEATRTGADFTAEGTGTALVNGVSTNIEFTATQTGSVATFEVRDADTLDVLAGGTGENDRSAFQLTVSP
jgi:hypothetical protein